MLGDRLTILHEGKIMKRSLIVPIIVLAFVSLACGMFTDTPAPAAPTIVPATTEAVVVAAEQATATLAQPTVVTELPTTAPEPTIPEPTATNAPTDTPLPPSEFEDTFDRRSDYWSDDVVVTTQTFGRDLQSNGTVQDGILRYRINDKETYLYKFFAPALPGDVSIETEFQSKGTIYNGIAIVCKVNEDRSSWFEVRVSSTSDYSFFRYEKRLRTEENKNPYVLLGKGKFKIDELYPTKLNSFKVTCLEDEIIMDTNRGMRVVSQFLDSSLDGSYVGIGVMSYEVIPVTIDFERILIRAE
jgi:hypothetical protein